MTTETKPADHYDYYLDIDVDNGVVDLVKFHVRRGYTGPMATTAIPDDYVIGRYNQDLDLWADDLGFTVLWNTNSDSEYGICYETEQQA